MQSSFMKRIDISAFSKNWLWFLIWGIALVILGIVAIGASVLTTIISVVFLGVLLLIGGIVVIVDAFTFWRKNQWGGFFLHLIMGALYFIVGAMLMKSPLAGSISLTFLLGLFYIITGIFRVFASISARTPQWKWGLFSGLIALLLGIVIMASWPVSGLYIIGLFVGIDLLVVGWAYIIAALTARGLVMP